MAKGKNGVAGNSELGNAGESIEPGSGAGGDSVNADSIGGIPVTDPGAGADTGQPSADGSEPKRKRGRPAGSGSKSSGTSQKAAAPTVTGVEKLLYGLHMTLAAGLSVPEIALDKEESRLLADATLEVARHYDHTVDPKTVAWIGFASTIGAIYGSKVLDYVSRKKRERKTDTAVAADPALVREANTGGAVMHFPVGASMQ